MEPRILIVITVVSLILGVSVLYIGRRLIRPARLGARVKRVLWLALTLCAVVGVISFLGGRLVPRSAATPFLNILGFSGMGVILTILPLLLARDLVLGGARVWAAARARQRGADVNVERRVFLARATGGLVVGAASASLAAGVVQAGRGPELVEVDIPIDDLPEAFDGYRIVQISDLHVGPVLGKSWLHEIVTMVNGTAPDLIAVTGDLIDGRRADIAPLLAPLAALKAADGAYFVTGNHEYYWDARDWIEEVGALGLTVLGNEHRVITRGTERLVVAGVHDDKADGFVPEHKSDPAAALAGAPDAAVRLLLAHQPKSLHAAKTLGYDLQLSGHTHGGQFFPSNLLIHLVQPAVAGLYRFDDMWVYVNRGTGWWGPPLRSPARGEVTLARLVRSAKQAAR